MNLPTDSTLVLIGIVAVLSPILAELTGRLGIPDVVFEIGLGIVIAVVMSLALTTTALGTLLPILRDADLFESRFGARSWRSAAWASSRRSWP